MTACVNRRVAAAVSMLLCCAAASPAMANDQCDTAAGFVDSKKLGFEARGHMYADCIDRGQPLRGLFYESDLQDVVPSTDKVIHLQPRATSQRLNVAMLARGCLSRVYFDIICKRHERLFSSGVWRLNHCPLSTFYTPSPHDVISSAMAQVFGGRDLCSSSARFLANDLRLGPGQVDEVELKVKNFGVVASSFTIANLASKRVELQDVVINGDLKIDSGSLGYVDLKRLIILGNLRIDASTIRTLSLESVWIAGDLSVTGNSFSGDDSTRVLLNFVKVAGRMDWSNNTTRARSASTRVEGLDIHTEPSVRGNKYDGADPNQQQAIERFDQELIAAYRRPR